MPYESIVLQTLPVAWIFSWAWPGSVLLEDQRVIPAKLLRQGFMFQYPEITEALKEVIEG